MNVISNRLVDNLIPMCKDEGKMPTIFLCFVFFLSQSQVEANIWESFFLERCETVPTPENAYYCPTYSWNPYEACVPWDTQYCQTSSLTFDPNCQGFNCKVINVLLCLASKFYMSRFTFYSGKTTHSRAPFYKSF